MNNFNKFSSQLRHPRTLNEAFPSGTAYAASIERTRRHDASVRLIVVVLVAVLAFAWVMS